ncbi:hypothetical protein Lalb_Chr07g0191051 [Lupinus albus]|uniref:Uncharacterized protein n=1 Tax=Lupinus albus TaxID=3870 RepID=A0A6A4QBH9_LUPAL|nr:hypothetical protein Lalb_Chr07g0191051 [Lupinus albus]
MLWAQEVLLTAPHKVACEYPTCQATKAEKGAGDKDLVNISVTCEAYEIGRRWIISFCALLRTT